MLAASRPTYHWCVQRSPFLSMVPDRVLEFMVTAADFVSLPIPLGRVPSLHDPGRRAWPRRRCYVSEAKQVRAGPFVTDAHH